MWCLVVSYILVFRALLCPFSVSCVLPSVHVCLPLSVSVFSSVLPLVTSPGLLPPLSPHLFLILSLVSVYIVFVFPLVFVCSLPLFLPLSAWWFLVRFLHFCLYFVKTFSVALCLAVLVATLVFGPRTHFHLWSLVLFCIQLWFNKAHFLLLSIRPPVSLHLGTSFSFSPLTCPDTQTVLSTSKGKLTYI